jgi:hypothetical protein
LKEELDSSLPMTRLRSFLQEVDEIQAARLDYEQWWQAKAIGR